MRDDSDRSARVRAEVRRLLASSPGFRALPEARRVQLERDMTRVAERVIEADDPAGTSRAVARALTETRERDKLRASVTQRGSKRASETVDFPAFVAGLVQGTFKAIVDASIQQMEGYADLLHDVAGAVDKFNSKNKRGEGDEAGGDDDG